jgi:hypothetical protein
MAAWVMLATVWTVGVPFYLRFLVALCKEFRHVKMCYLVRIQPTVSEVPLIEKKQEKMLGARAA